MARTDGRGRRLGLQAATAPEVDFVMSAIVGVAGLEATYEAVKAKKRIGLANKEVLVASGKLVMEAVREHGDRADSRRQRAQRGPSVSPGGSALRSDPPDTDRFRWSVSRHAARQLW